MSGFPLYDSTEIGHLGGKGRCRLSHVIAAETRPDQSPFRRSHLLTAAIRREKVV